MEGDSLLLLAEPFLLEVVGVGVPFFRASIALVLHSRAHFSLLPNFLLFRSCDLPLPYHLIDHMTSHMTSHLTLCQQHHMTHTKVLVPIVCLIGTPYWSPLLLFSYLLFYVIDPHFLLAMTS